MESSTLNIIKEPGLEWHKYTIKPVFSEYLRCFSTSKVPPYPKRVEIGI